MKIVHFIPFLIASCSLSLLHATTAPPSPPNGSWGNNVYYYPQGTSSATIQAETNAVFATNGGLQNEFATQGYAFLFESGPMPYSGGGLDIQIGYYTSIMGLGKKPGDTKISSVNSPQGSDVVCIGALNNFWRSAENFETTPSGGDMLWTASHGCSLRSVKVNGSLSLSQRTPSFEVGASTGAFIANCYITNSVNTAQRQLCVRNSKIDSTGTNNPWNAQSLGQIWGQTFVGCIGAPPTRCGNCNGNEIPGVIPSITGCTCTNALCPVEASCKGLPASNIASTPLIAEKPFIYYDGTFHIGVPAPRMTSSGPSGLDSFTASIIDFTDVFVATPTSNNIGETLAETLNNEISRRRAIIFTPGTYLLDRPLVIDEENFILLGIGFPILVSTDQNACIEVDNEDGVRISGIILQAGPSASAEAAPHLLRWGQGNTSDQEEDSQEVGSGYLYDCFARVGRFGNTGNDEFNSVNHMIRIQASNIVCDNVWAWRADHDAMNTSPQSGNFCAIGIQIDGNSVIAYGLASEGTFGKTLPQTRISGFRSLLEWYGNMGQCYSYQGTFPIDGTAQNDVYASAGYLLSDKVSNHFAVDVGIYSRLQSLRPITVKQGISSGIPINSVRFQGAFTRILSGNAIINSVINGDGVNAGVDGKGYVNNASPGPAYNSNSCVWTGLQIRAAFQSHAAQ